MKKRTSLKNLRSNAFKRQGGLCFYCCMPMWEKNQQAFADRYGLTWKQSRIFQCTGEHLTPHSLGGPASPRNIVAACLHCNKSRHKHGGQRTAEAHMHYVRARMKCGGWHAIWSIKLRLQEGKYIDWNIRISKEI